MLPIEALFLLSHYPIKMIYKLLSPAVWDFPVAQMVRNLLMMQEIRFDPRVRKIHWRSKWQSTPVFLPGESHGRGVWQATIRGLTKNRTHTPAVQRASSSQWSWKWKWRMILSAYKYNLLSFLVTQLLIQTIEPNFVGRKIFLPTEGMRKIGGK